MAPASGYQVKGLTQRSILCRAGNSGLIEGTVFGVGCTLATAFSLAPSKGPLLLFHLVYLWAHFFLSLSGYFCFLMVGASRRMGWRWEAGRPQVRGTLAVTQVATSM